MGTLRDLFATVSPLPIGKGRGGTPPLASPAPLELNICIINAKHQRQLRVVICEGGGNN